MKLNWKMFWKGVLAAFSFGLNVPRSEPRSDEEAMAEDWQNVGNDIRAAMSRWADEHQKKGGDAKCTRMNADA